MSRPLKSLQLPGLSETYTVPHAVNKNGNVVGETVSEPVAAASWVSALPTIYSGNTDPSPSLGKNGDIYIKYSI